MKRIVLTVLAMVALSACATTNPQPVQETATVKVEREWSPLLGEVTILPDLTVIQKEAYVIKGTNAQQGDKVRYRKMGTLLPLEPDKLPTPKKASE